MSHNPVQCTSDLTDMEWELLQKFLPLRKEGRGRPLKLKLRAVVNAINYRLSGIDSDNAPTAHCLIFKRTLSALSAADRWPRADHRLQS